MELVGVKSVKVHDETHEALKRLKAKRRSRSIDQVIKELMRNSGSPVSKEAPKGSDRITEYIDE